MSEQNKDKYKNTRYLGKVKNIPTQYGTMQKIYMDNLEHTNKDGTVNKYYKGALVWIDAETGKQYQVKQMSVFCPKDGMSAELVAKGFSHFITLNLDDGYEVTVLQ